MLGDRGSIRRDLLQWLYMEGWQNGNAAVLKTAGRKAFGVRIPGPPFPRIFTLYGQDRDSSVWSAGASSRRPARLSGKLAA